MLRALILITVMLSPVGCAPAFKAYPVTDFQTAMQCVHKGHHMELTIVNPNDPIPIAVWMCME